MSAPNTLTFDLVPSRRPSIDDAGGGVVENDVAAPPAKDGRMLYAEQQNQIQRQAVAAGGVIPVAILGVSFITTTPTITAFAAPGTTVLASSFELTDLGAGSTRVDWAAGILPTPVAPPTAHLHTDGDYTIVAVPGTNTVTVNTRLAGTLYDASFSLHIY